MNRFEQLRERTKQKAKREGHIPRVYISGPISKLPIEEYMENFKRAEKKLRESGYWTFNPAQANAHMPAWFAHEDFMEVCHSELALCDLICYLDGWEHSDGACTEHLWAQELRIPELTEHDI